MKKNILHSIVLLSALALASCSTTNQMASNKKLDDDVYFSKAEAGEAPVYRQPVREDRYVAGTNGDDDDYYYYDSYASRINRFGYNSPFDYYDDYYYGYNNPYAYNGFGPYGGLGYGGGWNVGIGLGFGYGGYGYGGWGNPWGLGYGYGGYGLGLGYGYGYGGFYSPYSYWGTGYGYGGGYWGAVSANNRSTLPPRYRGPGYPGGGVGGRSTTVRTSYNGNYPNTLSYPGRRPSSNGTSNGANYGGSRPVRGNSGNTTTPTYRPQREEVSRPAPQPVFDRGSTSSSSSGSSSGGGGASRGGGRPSRP